MDIVRGLLLTLGAYLGVGLLFGVVFVFRGAPRLDPHARGAPLIFRLFILPGSAALWPVLARRWARVVAESEPPQESAP